MGWFDGFERIRGDGEIGKGFKHAVVISCSYIVVEAKRKTEALISENLFQDLNSCLSLEI